MVDTSGDSKESHLTGGDLGSDTEVSCLNAEDPGAAATSGWWRNTLTRPLWWPVRMAVFYTGVVLPVICHLLTVSDPLPSQPTWQSGLLRDQLAYLLSFRGGWPVLPFLAFSIVCMTLVIFSEQRFGRRRLVRFGIFTGVPVTAWYAVVFGLTVGEMDNGVGLLVYGFGSVFAMVLGWAILRVLLWVRHRLSISWRGVARVGLPLLIGLWLTSAVVVSVNANPAGNFVEEFALALVTNVTVPIFVLFLMSIVFSTYWCLATYVGMSCRLAWLYPASLQFRLADLMGAFTWFAGFLAACRWAVILSLAEYAKLPVEDPGNCYIASTAAKGKPQIVSSRPVVTGAGKITHVNDQLVTFKAGELALRALLPSWHRQARQIYDVLGPVLSRGLQRQGCIEVGYFFLKPAEWLVRAGLAMMLGRRAPLWLARLYR